MSLAFFKVIIRSMKTFELGYSPCPNDTFIFDALLHGKLQNIRGQGHKVTHECEASGLEFHERLEDVETLNYLALAGRLDITKVSFGVITEVLDNYCLLRSGGALGRECGPLVVSRSLVTMESLKGKKVAIPGMHTTAYLLLRLFDPAFSENAIPMSFDLIMKAVESGEVDAGLALMRKSVTPLLEYGVSRTGNVLALMATALARHGEAQEGLELVTETLALAQRDDIRWWEAELHRVKGEILLARIPFGQRSG